MTRFAFCLRIQKCIYILKRFFVELSIAIVLRIRDLQLSNHKILASGCKRKTRLQIPWVFRFSLQCQTNNWANQLCIFSWLNFPIFPSCNNNRPIYKMTRTAMTIKRHRTDRTMYPLFHHNRIRGHWEMIPIDF